MYIFFYPILIFTMSIYPHNYAVVKNIMQTDIKKMTDTGALLAFLQKREQSSCYPIGLIKRAWQKGVGM